MAIKWLKCFLMLKLDLILLPKDASWATQKKQTRMGEVTSNAIVKEKMQSENSIPKKHSKTEKNKHVICDKR